MGQRLCRSAVENRQTGSFARTRVICLRCPGSDTSTFAQERQRGYASQGMVPSCIATCMFYQEICNGMGVELKGSVRVTVPCSSS
jgi:hypothetical protein